MQWVTASLAVVALLDWLLRKALKLVSIGSHKADIVLSMGKMSFNGRPHFL